MLIYLIIYMLLVSPVLSSPPRCRILSTNRQLESRAADLLDCSCKSIAGRSYIGNLNFLKVHLEPIKLYNRTVDISLKRCDKLELELNFDDIPKKINLRILETQSLEINQIRQYTDEILRSK